MKKKTEVDVFMEIWNESDKRSFISGKDLTQYQNTNFFIWCFAHVIPKNGLSNLVFPNKTMKDELLRHNKENIVLVDPHEHHLIDHGTEDERKEYERVTFNCSFKPFYDLKEELVNKFKERIKDGY